MFDFAHNKLTQVDSTCLKLKHTNHLHPHVKYMSERYTELSASLFKYIEENVWLHPHPALNIMLDFHRSRLSYDLEILYDRGVACSLILDGWFVLGCPWLNLTDHGQ